MAGIPSILCFPLDHAFVKTKLCVIKLSKNGVKLLRPDSPVNSFEKPSSISMTTFLSVRFWDLKWCTGLTMLNAFDCGIKCKSSRCCDSADLIMVNGVFKTKGISLGETYFPASTICKGIYCHPPRSPKNTITSARHAVPMFIPTALTEFEVLKTALVFEIFQPNCNIKTSTTKSKTRPT